MFIAQAVSILQANVPQKQTAETAPGKDAGAEPVIRNSNVNIF